MKRASLKFILTAWSLGILAILATVVAAAAYHLGSSKITEHYQDQMKTVVRIVAFDFDNFLKSHANLAKTLAADERVVQSVRSGRPIASPFLKEILERYGVYENVFAYGSKDGDLVVTDALAGKTIGYGASPESRKDLDTFRASVRERSISIGNAKKSPITGATVVVLSAPIRSEGKTIGVLSLALSLDAVSDQLVSSAQLGKEGYVSVVENDGFIIAHKKKELILKMDISKQPFGKKLLELKEGEVFKFFFLGQDRFATIRRLNDWNMSIVAIQPIGEISESLNELIAGILLISFLMASVSGLLLYRMLAKRLGPLGSVGDVFRKMSDGDLTQSVRAEYSDEIGTMSSDMNSFIGSLSGSIRNVQNVSSELSYSANELSNSSQSFATIAQSTAASSEEMSATTEEMSAGMENISAIVGNQYRNIHAFHSKIKELSRGVREIGSEIETTLERANAISTEAKKGQDSLSSMSSTLGKILKSSDQMTDITKIINEISDQTQLLSLNASIEAARAGDAGKGFAVVANEISKLSEKTASAIQSISSMIAQNKTELDGGVEGVRSSVDVLQRIIFNVDAVASGMKELYEITKSQDVLNSEVDLQSDRIGAESESVKIAIEEQKRAVREIAEVISRLNEQALGTASSSEQVSATSIRLFENAELLKNISGQFIVQP